MADKKKPKKILSTLKDSLGGTTYSKPGMTDKEMHEVTSTISSALRKKPKKYVTAISAAAIAAGRRDGEIAISRDRENRNAKRRIGKPRGGK